MFCSAMAEVTKVLYIVVASDEDDGRDAAAATSFRYTRPVLQSTFQLMGCKARHAFKVHDPLLRPPLFLFCFLFIYL